MKSPKMEEFSTDLSEYISPEQEYFEAQRIGAKTQPLEHEGRGSVWKWRIVKHEIKYSLSKQIFPKHLDATRNAMEEIKS